MTTQSTKTFNAGDTHNILTYVVEQPGKLPYLYLACAETGVAVVMDDFPSFMQLCQSSPDSRQEALLGLFTLLTGQELDKTTEYETALASAKAIGRVEPVNQLPMQSTHAHRLAVSTGTLREGSQTVLTYPGFEFTAPTDFGTDAIIEA